MAYTPYVKVTTEDIKEMIASGQITPGSTVCDSCHGTGECPIDIYDEDDKRNDDLYEECKVCGGNGHVC